jgi:hypothetical protein
MIAIINAIKAFFGFAIPSVYVYLTLGAVVLGAWLGFKTHYYNEGWRAHAAAVEKAYKAAGKRANGGAEKVRACLDAGRRWQQGTGKCVH